MLIPPRKTGLIFFFFFFLSFLFYFHKFTTCSVQAVYISYITFLYRPMRSETTERPAIAYCLIYIFFLLLERYYGSFTSLDF